MKFRKNTIYFFIYGVFIFYIYNLISFQFSKEGIIYKEKAKKQFLRKRILEPKRGTIYDRKFRPLAFSRKDGEKWIREYPYGEICAPLIGFVGKDGNGLEGIEYYFEKILKGKKGYQILYRTRNGKYLPLPDFPEKEPESGKDIILTIDIDFQEIAFRNLEEWVKNYKAQRGFVIILNPETGEILSLASYPSYNPKEFPPSLSPDYRCLPITYIYEPGSVFKIVTYVTFIKEGKHREIQKVNAAPGSLIIKGIEIHDPPSDIKRNYFLSPEEVIIHSSNIGISRISLSLPDKKIYENALLMGFGVKTGIDFPGEATGKLKDYKEWDEIYKCTFSFGQGIFVNGIQLSMAYASIANGGYLLQPFLLRGIIDGTKIKLTNFPKIIRKIFSEEEVKILKNTLKRVVEEGSGRSAKFGTIAICGKTGTAQKFDTEKGEYDSEREIMSFVGFFPAENPKYLIYVLLDEPKKGRFASEVAAPLFREIAIEIYKLENPMQDLKTVLMAKK